MVPSLYLGWISLTVSSPLTDAFSCLKETGVVALFEGLVGLSDEGGGPLDALLTAGNLLR